jgi:uncharacterized protein
MTANAFLVHLVPRAKTTEVVGRYGDAIRIRVAAPPVEGAANAELVRFLAERLGVARSAVTIVRGQHARRKAIAIQGVDAATAERLLLGA